MFSVPTNTLVPAYMYVHVGTTVKLFIYKPGNLRLAALLLPSSEHNVLAVFAAFLAKQVQLPSLKEQCPDLENTQRAS